mmetsp:Transcript_8376/g.30986  ORF Transcript_8376/g.30986 Transcript_8376/m.30986 type:complete len:137 (+) Transcript_8376:447-857(+)
MPTSSQVSTSSPLTYQNHSDFAKESATPQYTQATSSTQTFHAPYSADYGREASDARGAMIWAGISGAVFLLSFFFGFAILATLPMLYCFSRYRNSPSRTARVCANVCALATGIILGLYVLAFVTLVFSLIVDAIRG